jgi:hypothetical protein
MGYYDPYSGYGSDERRWLKSQFHMHNVTFDEEGKFRETIDGMEAFFREYKAAHYDIVAHSPHNGWFDTSHLDEVVGIRSFNNEEYVDLDGILLVGARREYRGKPQAVVDEVNADGGFAVICHPNQNPELGEVSDLIPPLLTREVSVPLTGVAGVEIYNGCLPRRHWDGVGFGLGLATDYWDDALSSGRLLWGFGGDDSHQGYEINVGWTEILAESDELSSVVAAVKRGALTASRGMRLFGWTFNGTTLEVEADLPYYRTYDAEYSFIGEGGRVLARERGRTAKYEIPGSEPYVRVEARNDDGSVLWTQPLLRDDVFAIRE